MMCTPYPRRPGEADCRDYLRTGRCKYGDSCKYNHPPNVESGGGVKPINPSEPLFPIRPMEPPCQYFLKHGTCKFGQSCKFNHPTAASLADAGGGGGGLPAGQLVFVTQNAAPGDASSHLMTAASSVQVLPQRPTEPNCIYFLRNGKCKYGATCKFHHPLDAINRNNQVQHMQPTNMRQSHNARERSASASPIGSSSDGRPQIQLGLTYATSNNITYVQPQRLQPITERVRPQKPTHILLPDGQIAVILDPQSLQNVNELNVQERPKFYVSQTDGSIGTLPSIDRSNNPVVISPMLTATTNSTSNNTFDSSIDLMGTNVVTFQGQAQGGQSRAPQKSGSGGSLSAYGSLDSCEYVQQGPGQNQSQQMSTNLGQVSFPEYAAWPSNEALEYPNQTQAQKMSPSLETTTENNAIYWPENGSFSSIPATERENQGRRNYPSMPNASHHRSSHAVGQATQRPNSANSIAPPSASSERLHGRHENTQPFREPPDDEEGLTMMTSALLTMMDRHDSSSSENEGSVRKSTSRNSLPSRMSSADHNNELYDHQGESKDGSSPLRPPPGMSIPGIAEADRVPFASSNFNHQPDFDRSRSPPGGGYFIGGYNQSTSGTFSGFDETYRNSRF